MTDVTTPLNELRAAYRAYQSAKRDKKEEITEKYRARMEDEIRAAVEAEKYAFASLLKDRKEFYGLNVTDIQDHVLRTRNWKVWEDIRDYADIKPEQILRDDARTAKREANAATIFDRDALTLTVRKDQNGKTLETPVVYDLTTVRRIGPSRDMWNALPHDEDLDEAVRREAGQPYFRYLSNEIDRLISSGEVADPRENG